MLNLLVKLIVDPFNHFEMAVELIKLVKAGLFVLLYSFFKYKNHYRSMLYVISDRWWATKNIAAATGSLSIHHLLRRPTMTGEAEEITSSERVTPEVNLWLWVRWAMGGGGVNYLLPPRTGWPTTKRASYSDNSVQFSRDSAVVPTVREQILCRWHSVGLLNINKVR